MASCKQAGNLLVAVLPLLLLFLVFFLGSLKITLTAQARVALQSRLDTCAVRLASERRQALLAVQKSNLLVRSTKMAIYAARGVAIFTGPVGMGLSSAAQAALVQVNQATALAQDGLLALAQAREVAHLVCEASQYSKSPAFCFASPALVGSLRRGQSFFPDVRDALVHRRERESLATFRCVGGLGVQTELELRGDPALGRGDILDGYQK